MEKALDTTWLRGKTHIARFVVNGLRENTYILYKEREEALIIDCGARREDERNRIAAYVEHQGLKISAHLLTHCHFDHLWGAQWIYERYGVTPTIPRGEHYNYTTAQQMATQVYHKPIPLPLPSLPLTLTDSAYGMRVIHTPGHTMGSVCFYDEADAFLLSGDSLFKGYIGLPKETDIPSGMMLQTLQDRIYTLPGNTFVLPGHGPEISELGTQVEGVET